MLAFTQANQHVNEFFTIVVMLPINKTRREEIELLRSNLKMLLNDKMAHSIFPRTAAVT